LLWSDPRAWADGRVPGPGDVANIDRPVVVEGSVQVGGVNISATGALIFAPGVPTRLISTGNIVVAGVLAMRPLAPTTEHRITFSGIDETDFVGGGMEVLPTDIGLWVIGNGILDAVGTPKTSWTRLSGGVEAGATALRCDDTSGWLPGDRVTVTPTIAPELDPKSRKHADAYDTATVTAVLPGQVILDRALAHPHPAVSDAFGNRWTAEVLNLSRNVVIEGSPQGRAHIMFLHTQRPQHLSDIEVRHMGPREAYLSDNGRPRTRGVLGRYPFHFHLCHWASKGSHVKGVVIHSSGNHAFVPHESHAITFEDCVAHDTFAEPYWWDVAARGEEQMPTHETMYLRCVGSMTRAEQSTPEAYRVSAFHLGKGEEGSNRAIGCVAVGVDDGHQSSGFSWPERSRGVWGFEDCIAHNNVNHGIMSWQNTEDKSRIGNFQAYHNGGSGVLHGAYSNFWLYEDIDAYANRYAGLEIHAVTRQTNFTRRTFPEPWPLLTFRNFRIDPGEVGRYGIATESHRLPAHEGVPTLIENCDVRAAREAAFRMGPWNNREEYEITNCRLDGTQFYLDPGMNPTSFATVRDLHGAVEPFSVWLAGSKPGVPRVEWNAVLTPVTP
jgi:hypothetical protein